MTNTLSTLQANMQVYLNRTDIDTQITLALNRAILHYSRLERSWFSETVGTFSTVTNQISYGTADGVPSDILNIDNVELTINSSDTIRLIPRTYRYVQERNIANVPGVPGDYAYYMQKFFIYPIPDAVYVTTVSYLKGYADLSVAGDSNNFTDNVADLIEARACWWIYSRILKQTENANAAKADELDALFAVQSETSRLNKSGKVRATTF